MNVPGRAVGVRRLIATTQPKSRAILKQALTSATSRYPAEPLTVALIPSRSWTLGNVLADVLILTVCQLVDVAVEDHFPVAQHEKTHGDVAVLAFGQYPHLIC